MKIHFSIKRLGKKRPFLSQLPIEIPGEYGAPYPLQTILEQIVQQQVAAFNQKREEKSLFSFFKEEELTQEAQTGSVKFGEIYNDTQADLQKAIETVLLAFEDGLIAIFIDDSQIESLDQEIVIQETTIFTIIRLTFLAGGIY